MKIGIIGAGNIGGNLTRRFTAAGHEVRVANSRGPETLADLADLSRDSGVLGEPARDGDYRDDDLRRQGVLGDGEGALASPHEGAMMSCGDATTLEERSPMFVNSTIARN